MNSSRGDRGRQPAVRIVGVGLGMLGAVGGVAGWFTLAAAEDVATSSFTLTEGTVAGGSSVVAHAVGPAHTRTGGS